MMDKILIITLRNLDTPNTILEGKHLLQFGRTFLEDSSLSYMINSIFSGSKLQTKSPFCCLALLNVQGQIHCRVKTPEDVDGWRAPWALSINSAIYRLGLILGTHKK